MGHAATVQEIYQAFGSGDIPAILATLADDVRWDHWDVENRGNAGGVPWLTTREGVDGVAEFFRVISTWKPERFDVLDLMESGNQVSAELSVAFVLPGGERLVDEEMHLWTFDDAGKVTRFRHYCDTANHLEVHAKESA